MEGGLDCHGQPSLLISCPLFDLSVLVSFKLVARVTVIQTMTTGSNPISERRDFLVRYAPIVLAGCGAVSIWLAPSIWLHERQHITIEQVKGDLTAEIQQVRGEIQQVRGEIQQVRDEISEVRADVRQISTRMDQLIHILADAP